MSRFHSYINSACKILQQYGGDLPFSIFIKQFFSKEKKFGSSDRKQISALCYNYFRIGLALKKKISADTLLVASFLCSKEKSSLITNLKPEWEEMLPASIEKKINFLRLDIKLPDLFPFKEETGATINLDQFYRSFLLQPDLFIRIRPAHATDTLKKIAAAVIPFTQVTKDCIEYPPSTDVERFLILDKEIVIQDYHSQQVLNYLKEHTKEFSSINALNIWDCCAASGGKSILLKDILTNFKLTVSDIRPGIMANLQQRFKRASINNYEHFIADLSKPILIPDNKKFDIIICDAPCTGSGTWSRTPEQLYFFNPSSINEFSRLQKTITANLIPHLKTNGFLFYITCSVFKKENEEVAQYIEQELKLQIAEMKNLYGYEKKADSMFVTVFKKN